MRMGTLEGWRNGAPPFVGFIGAIELILYDVVPTYQAAHFGRVYAAVRRRLHCAPVLWGWAIDRIAPDRFDLLGGALWLAGIGVIMYWPR